MNSIRNDPGAVSADRIDVPAPSREHGLRGRVLDKLSHGFERVTRGIREKQFSKMIERRSGVATQLRAIPHRLQKITHQSSLVLELIDDYRDGTYREVTWYSVAVASATLLYTVSPADVIPDVIPIVGQLDDVVVLSLGMHLLKRDLRAYVTFKGYDADKYF